jgi:hypothetical protein
MKYLVVAAALCFGAAVGRPDGAGHSHDHSHDHSAAAPTAPQAPSSGYSPAAASGYSSPGQSYEQPSAYAAPSSGYEQPAAGYEQPYEQSYAAPTSYGQSYEAAPAAAAPSFPNLGLVIIPLLIVAGLALLFPSTTIVPVRRKRDTEGESSPNSLVERVQDIYASVLESEECLERVACEVGAMVEDMGVNKSMLSVAEPFMPTKYSKYVKKFATGKDCHKIKCGSLF